jgi:hypothetical protein
MLARAPQAWSLQLSRPGKAENKNPVNPVDPV